jgi:glycosyltransferase involved in cell wall biosynthesis
MISVIVIAKNAEQTIRIAIKSLLLALGKNDEVLVLLDACTDRTEVLVKNFKDHRIRIFSVTETLGRSRGRNYLINESKGDIIGILDADDIALPWRFLLAKRLLRHYDAVFGTALLFGSDLGFLPFVPQILRRITSENMPVECLGRNPIVHSSATFLRSALNSEVAYRDSEAEEYDLWLRMLNSNKKLIRTAIPVVMYRLHAKQESKKLGFNERGQNCSLVIGQQIKLARKIGISECDVRNLRSIANEMVNQLSLLARIEIIGLKGLKNAVLKPLNLGHPD